MATLYTSSTSIWADKEAVADFFKQPNLRKDYFPEVKNNVSSTSEHQLSTAINPAADRPHYINENGFGWAVDSETSIELPRKDIHANIQTIDVEYKQSGNKTVVRILVKFNPRPGSLGLSGLCSLAASHVRMMVFRKLTAIKRDVEANQQYGWADAAA